MEADKLGQGDIAFQANLYESANPSRRWLHGGRRAWVTGAIQRFARRRGTRFLEIGIGCGLYTAEMARLGPVLAIDINPGFVAAVAGLENVEARVEDVTSLSLRPSYDVAVCSEVIEHLPGSQRALANISQALRPGGVLILTTPHAYSTAELFARLLVFPLVRGIVRRLYAEHVEDLGHINRLTRAALLGQACAEFPCFASCCGRSAMCCARSRAAMLDRTLLRFLLMGAANTALGLSVIFGLQLFFSPVVANWMAFVLLVPVTFMAHRNWSFRDGGGLVRSFVRYLPVVALGYAVNRVVLEHSLTQAIEAHLAQGLAIAAYVTVTYLLLRLFVFLRPRDDSSGG
ncbi:MAG: hypothetical protein RJB37_4185 [Pseudomonadota bacterium]